MRVSVVAVGRMKAGPETELAGRYLGRFAKAGGGLGLDFAGLRELAESRLSAAPERKRDEAARLLAALPSPCLTVALDEGGRDLSSADFAADLARLRDAGTRDIAFVIGGADGLDSALTAGAARRLAFGRMTWPHQLVRLLLAEQLYRATTILAGHPYHRA